MGINFNMFFLNFFEEGVEQQNIFPDIHGPLLIYLAPYSGKLSVSTGCF